MSLDVNLKRIGKITYDQGQSFSEISEYVYENNITHNLWVMADKAGIYEALWRPHRLNPDYNIPNKDSNEELEFEGNSITYARDIIPVLQKGLIDLKLRPDYFIQFNSENGWGTYPNLVRFVSEYLDACETYPDSIVSVCR